MSDFVDVVNAVRETLARERRMSYRMLKRRFSLSDDDLEDLKSELIDAKCLARDEDGKVLVWASQDLAEPGPQALTPVSYTPGHLAERIRSEQQAMEASGSDGERKTITALFADLKGSTALLADLDPEDAKALIDPALRVMMDAVHRYEGYVAQALGDGILALFGAPLAHEDHAQRAVYAALSMQTSLQQYAATVQLKHGVPLAMRVGINTGEVVVRSIRKDDLHTDYVPIGHSINLASRLEQMAAPGSVLMTGVTHRLVEGYFETKALGAAQIKGVSQHLDIYEVTAASQLRTRLQVSARRGLAPFTGRNEELAQLQKALEQARSGHGQLVGLMGEAGMGKSRLVLEFKRRTQGFTVLEAYSAPHGTASPYFPLIELLKNYFHILPADDEHARREKIIGKLLGLDRRLADVLPYYFALLNVADPDSPLPLTDPQSRRRQIFEALKRGILRASVEHPLMLIFEDLHWIDRETHGFINALAESISGSRILLLTNYRPEYRNEWAANSNCTQIRLAPLAAIDADAFLSALLGQCDEQTSSPSLAALRQHVLSRAEGTPFFIEELVQELFEQAVLERKASGAVRAMLPAGAAVVLPASIQGVLAARIDRLRASEKSLLQQLAVVGREFPLGLVRRVVQLPDETLQGLLHALQAKEFIYEQAAAPENRYFFKHALTQDVAYQSLLLERRKIIHQRTAEAIEDLFTMELDDQYVNLARHYGRSGHPEKAVAYLELAGRQAVRRSAVADAVSCFSEALELLRGTPESPARSRHQLDLALALIPAVHMHKGMASSELEALCVDARALCERVGGPREMLTILVELRTHYCVRGQCLEALRYAEELMKLADGAEDRVCTLHAHVAMTVSHFYLGDFSAARRHAQFVRRLYKPETDHLQIVESGFDPKILSIWYEALADWIQGRSSSLSDLEADSAALTSRIAHPHVLGMVELGRIYTTMLWGDATGCLQASDALVALATAHQFPDWLTFARASQGWATEKLGGRAGLATTLAAESDAEASGTHLLLPWMLLLIADIYMMRGDIRSARVAVERAQSIAGRNNDQSWAAEYERVLGDIALSDTARSSGAVVTAATHYRRAKEIADAQGAASWSLRAQIGLSRLRVLQGHAEEAYSELEQCVARLQPGFESPDQAAARALLRDLPGATGQESTEGSDGASASGQENRTP